MSINHNDFFDLLKSNEISNNEHDLRKSFELIINGFMANEIPNLDAIALEHIDAFEQQFEQIRHRVMFNRDGTFRVSGTDCLLKEFLHLHLFSEQLEKIEKQGIEDEIFI
ncbi:hypothetical protein COO03_04590 [Bacillus sp. AFS098217]|uniref:hypothetical protein n=1 Tax=Bacillus sp. AFS098217 TaxID=2033868 RepID=UPI000BEBEDCB|nr:hypothetical protein [Bacillus sp. AFS098217]PEB54527.1 hypothetical protein COO03_04590 [Bacillus sp. AFS098217]